MQLVSYKVKTPVFLINFKGNFKEEKIEKKNDPGREGIFTFVLLIFRFVVFDYTQKRRLVLWICLSGQEGEISLPLLFPLNFFGGTRYQSLVTSYFWFHRGRDDHYPKQKMFFR